MRFIDPDGMYSTEEWKKDNGITDDDLITIYQAPSEEDNSQNPEPEKEEKKQNLIESSIKAWGDNFKLSGSLVNNLFGNEDASESENIELGYNLWTFKFMLFAAMLEPGASNSNSTNKINSSSKSTTAKGGVAEARALGIAGEEAVGVGAKTRIPSLTGTAKYRIPDQLTSTTLGEVKNVGH